MFMGVPCMGSAATAPGECTMMHVHACMHGEWGVGILYIYIYIYMWGDPIGESMHGGWAMGSAVDSGECTRAGECMHGELAQWGVGIYNSHIYIYIYPEVHRCLF